MNLIQQFPDVSEERRNRLKGNQKRSRTKLPVGSAKDNDARLVQFYDHEFKKWHWKLGLIIGVGIACLYSVVLTVSEIFQWIIVHRNSYNI